MKITRKACAQKVSKKRSSKLVSLPDIFIGAGFTLIPSDTIHFRIQQRQGEIDFIFAHKNVIVLCEETGATNEISNHFSKKKLFHSIIEKNPKDFFDIYSAANTRFKDYVDRHEYDWDDLELRYLYFSSAVDCDSSLFIHSKPIQILSRTDANYFKSLSKIIGKSSKYELLKYLKVTLSQIGEARSAASNGTLSVYDAFAKSGAHTNYPDGFGIVSFYADPASLIERSYVLRRDGWEASEISYQRFLVPKKLSAMRDYLADTKRVFVNNLIVTLPDHVRLTDCDGAPVNLSSTFTGTVSLELPNEFGTVGVVDGQHRIFSYHEGDDSNESKIKALRRRQNLLVTGIVFPKSYTPAQRAQFEAELFLSINNTQTKVKADLRQELEALTKPSSTIAICKSVIRKLAKSGALAGLLQEGLYDPPEKIRTSSLVRYVLPSLIKIDGTGSLYQHFSDGTADLNDEAVREKYVEFCYRHINTVLLAARTHLSSAWKPRQTGESGVLSPTSIGGLLLLLRDLIENYVNPLSFDFEAELEGIENFDFSSYTSSRWSQLGAKLLADFFPD